ncbi:hypothetical protein [Acaricomes phytoseiuli]|uniref:hypothetical protein n=1 Tax=Acaricomes phytoseiuli TaxID=291968 RepID=UPI0003628E99|nr:hypothetical protein [Acaricomes phytoseiuli]
MNRPSNDQPERIVEYRDTTGNGLTLAKLRAFIQSADDANTPPETILRVRVGFRSQIKAITTGKKTP